MSDTAGSYTWLRACVYPGTVVGILTSYISKMLQGAALWPLSREPRLLTAMCIRRVQWCRQTCVGWHKRTILRSWVSINISCAVHCNRRWSHLGCSEDHCTICPGQIAGFGDTAGWHLCCVVSQLIVVIVANVDCLCHIDSGSIFSQPSWYKAPTPSGDNRLSHMKPLTLMESEINIGLRKAYPDWTRAVLRSVGGPSIQRLHVRVMASAQLQR